VDGGGVDVCGSRRPVGRSGLQVVALAEFAGGFAEAKSCIPGVL
jgi:hypothetical protein